MSLRSLEYRVLVQRVASLGLRRAELRCDLRLAQEHAPQQVGAVETEMAGTVIAHYVARAELAKYLRSVTP